MNEETQQAVETLDRMVRSTVELEKKQSEPTKVVWTGGASGVGSAEIVAATSEVK